MSLYPFFIIIDIPSFCNAPFNLLLILFYFFIIQNLVPTKYQKKKIHKLNSLLHLLVDDSQSSETQDSQFDNQFTRRKDIASAMFVKFLGYLQSNLNHKRRWRRLSYAHKSSRTCNPVLQTPRILLLNAIR